jgi:hypothetical protein
VNSGICASLVPQKLKYIRRKRNVRTSYSGTRVAPVAHIYYGISPTARFNIHTQDNKNKQLSALLKPLLNPPPITIAKVHNPNNYGHLGRLLAQLLEEILGS